jgi:PAS domain S-box-containing protein
VARVRLHPGKLKRDDRSTDNERVTPFRTDADGRAAATSSGSVAELVAFQEIAAGLIDRLDVDGVLETILERAAALAGTTDAYLYLPEGDELVVRFGLGQFESQVGFRLARGHGLAGRVFESGEPLVVDDYQTWAGRRRDLDGRPFHAVIGVPLSSRDAGVAGVIGIAHSEIGRFGPEEVDLLRRFADLASLALENARLYTAAREGEERYRGLVSNIPGAIYRAALDGTWSIHFMSDAVEPLCGYPAEDFTSGRRTVASLIHPDDVGEVIEEFERLVQTGLPYALEYRIVHRDGSARWVLERSRGIKTADGRVILDGALFDTTERRDAEERVRAAEAQYRSLVEHLPLVTYVRPLQLGYGNLYVSPQVEEMLGTSEEEWLKDDLLERVVHPDDLERVVGAAERLRTTGEPTSEEYRIVRPDGKVVWVLDETRLITDAAGAPAFVQGFLADITQRREAEEMRSQLGAVVASSYDAIYGTALDDSITSWNSAATRIYGYTANEIIGRNVSVLTPEGFEYELATIRDRVVENGESLVLDTIRRRKDGGLFDASVTVAPVLNANGDVIGTARVLRDATDRRRAEAERERLLVAERAAREAAETAQRELAAQNTQLRELDRLKDEFIALVSHELRTPLTSIRGYIDLILEDEALTDQQRRFLQIADRNSDRLLRLVGDLLFLAQLESGTLDLAPERVDLASVAADSVTAAQPAAEAKEIALEFSAEGPAPLEGDPARLGQVVDNLVSNAIKFTPAGGSVIVSVGTDGPSAALEVRDSGIGIAAADHAYLFDRFFRTAEANERAIPGTGLGLTVSKALVEAHGGTISVAGVEDGGTVFRVELPLPKADAAQPRAAFVS